MMKINTKTLLIINPAAGNGSAGRKRSDIDTLADKFFSEHQTVMTEAPGQAKDYGVQFHPESILTDHGHALLKNFLEQSII